MTKESGREGGVERGKEKEEGGKIRCKIIQGKN